MFSRDAGSTAALPPLQGPHAVSIEFQSAPWTRIDPAINFRGDTLPIHFSNDLGYNAAVDRRSPPLSAHYVGYVALDQPGTLRTIVATTNGVDVSVDGTSVFTRAATESGHTSRVP